GLVRAPSDDLDEYDCRTNELSFMNYGPSASKRQQAKASVPRAWRLLPAARRVMRVAGQVVGAEDRQQRHGDDKDRRHIGERAFARTQELAQHPDRQGFLLSRGESRDDNLVETKGESEHAARQQRCGNIWQHHMAKGL